MKTEILRRLSVLDKKEFPCITTQMRQGGMQERLNRQDIVRYGNQIKAEKKKLKDKLLSLEKEKDSDFLLFSSSSSESLNSFNEPKRNKIRSARGFF